jgi:hypothetical protein
MLIKRKHIRTFYRKGALYSMIKFFDPIRTNCLSFLRKQESTVATEDALLDSKLELSEKKRYSPVFQTKETYYEDGR